MDAEHSQQATQQEPGPSLYFCHLCQSQYQQPKLLKCLHSFCMRCLQGITIQDDGNDVVICPLCSYATHLPPGGTEALTDNPFLQRISSDYVTEVKSNMVAKSLSPQTARKLGSHEACTATRGTRRVSEELAHLKLANLTDEQKTVTSQYTTDANLGHTPVVLPELRRSSVDRGDYTASSMEAVNNMSRLQGKLMNLQGEALRVTYAIDSVNQHMTNWHQHKEDLKLEVQRRSHEFQIAAKKMERQILSQIESKTMEDQFYSQLDRCKSDLRRNLKNILHEVSVLKSVHELGKFTEINDLSSSLLGPSVGMTNVVLDMLSYQFDIPTKTIEEMIAVGFGNLITSKEESRIFVPEEKDFTNIPVDEITTEYQQDKEFTTQLDISTETTTTGRARGRTTASRRSLSTTGRSKRYTSDLGLRRSDVKEHLEEFQNARETFRTKRQEILRQGQHAREDLSPLRGEGRKLPFPTFRRGRVQSLDRSSNPHDRGRKTIRKVDANNSNQTDIHYWGESNTDQDEEQPQKKPEDLNMPSPIIEEGVIPDSPKKGATQDQRIPIRFVPPKSSPGDKTSAEMPAPEDRRHRMSSLWSGSRHSSLDETPPLSPNAETSGTSDLRANANEGGRPLRKALSSAGDKRSKMEFLRENWQKRKEILIQSQGFLSSETSSSTGISGSPVSSPGTLLAHRRFSDTRKEDVVNISKGILTNRSNESVPKTTSTNVKQQEAGRKTVQIASPPTTVTARPLTMPFRYGQQTIPAKAVQEIGKFQGSDCKEQEVTSTITIPISSKLQNDMPTEVINDVQQSKPEEEEEEEEIVTTETFTINKDPLTQNYIEEESKPKSALISSKPSVQSEANLPTMQATLVRSTASHSTMHAASIPTTTLTSPTASPLHTNIITGTTLIAPSTVVPKTSTISSPSASSTSLPLTTTTMQTTVRSHSSVSSRFEKPSPSTISSPSAPPSATTTATITSSSLLARTTTTSTSTSSQSTTTTTSSNIGGYSHRYVPKMETIDVAALLANMYKPAPSSSQKDDSKKKDDEEKENIKNERENQIGIHTMEQKTPETRHGNDKDITKPAFSYNYSSSSERTSTLDNKAATDPPETKSSQITVYKITDDSKNSHTSTTEKASTESSSHILLSNRHFQSETTPIIKESNINIETPPKPMTGNTLDPANQSGPLAPSSPRDKKVDETFNQAESNRKRFSPATSRSSNRSSRRHTVEISKTIPQGMRLSDMYQPTSRDTLSYGQRQSDLQRTVIEEAQDESTKDSIKSEAKILTIKIPDSSSRIESTSLSPKSKGEEMKVDTGMGGSRIPMGVFPSLSGKQSDSGTLSPSSPVSVTSVTSYSSLTSDPTAGQLNANLARGKLRDIARKKKERWRRLTIS